LAKQRKVEKERTDKKESGERYKFYWIENILSGKNTLFENTENRQQPWAN
jgi:hypothetical protein